MTTLERLNLRYYRATDPREQAELLAVIEEFETSTTCYACGEPIEEGGCCWNPQCPEGLQNLNDEAGDRAYHLAADMALCREVDR